MRPFFVCVLLLAAAGAALAWHETDVDVISHEMMPEPVGCTIDCASFEAASASMHACNLQSGMNHVAITFAGQCNAAWLMIPAARYVTLQGPATIHGGGLRPLVSGLPQSIYINDIHFNGAYTHDELFAQPTGSFARVVISNATFANWAGAGVIRLESTIAKLANISMKNIVGYAFHCSKMLSFHAENVTCEHCAQYADSSCGHVDMTWYGSPLVMARVSCTRHAATEPVGNACIVDQHATTDMDGYGVTLFSNIAYAIESKHCHNITVRSIQDWYEEALDAKDTQP